jgi:hypothetical protein
MKFYLSSYKLGDRTAVLKDMIAGLNKKTAYISNALDFSTDLESAKKAKLRILRIWRPQVWRLKKLI